jgi:hypothetical protein
MNVCFSKSEPQTRVSGKQREKAAKGKMPSAPSPAVVIVDIVAVFEVVLDYRAGAPRGRVRPPFPSTLIVSQRSEAVKGKAPPRNNSAPLTAPARRKRNSP